MSPELKIEDDYLVEIKIKTSVNTITKHNWFDDIYLAEEFINELDENGCIEGFKVETEHILNVGDFIKINKKAMFMGVSFGTIEVTLTRMR